MAKNILITGGAGFVGSNLAVFLKKKAKGNCVICFDNLIRRGSELNAARLNDHGIKFIKGDIRSKQQLFKLENIATIIDCAAEPSVLAAYRDPNYTINTNLIGTLHALELAKREKAQFIFISTNRVYPIDQLEAIPFVEKATRFDWETKAKGPGYTHAGITHEFSLLGTRSLYGASKLCSEHLAVEYFDMFQIPGVINRFGIIAGPWQMGKIDQGILPLWIAEHKYGGKLKYIGYGGNGKQIRDALHIDDVCELIWLEMRHLKKLQGQTFNAGGGRKNAFSLLELTLSVRDITKRKILITSNKKNRLSDVRIYVTDNAPLTRALGWQPQRSLDNILTDIDIWIDANFEALKTVFVN